MKFIFIKSTSMRVLFFAAFAWTVSACLPDTSSNSLDPSKLPDATFTVTPVTGLVNRYIVATNDPSIFIHQWDFGDGAGKVQGHSGDTIYYPAKGDYKIKLYAVNGNGTQYAEQTVNVAEDDPNSCFGMKALLTGCLTGESKTWTLLKTEGGALFVGPPGLGSAWWQNSLADVSDPARVCMFDDEYTFTKSGGFNFEVFGNMRVDDENSAAWPTDIGLSIGCHDMTEIPDKYKAWGSGNFNFKIIGEKQLQVIGTGAHLGLYKVGETGTTDHPEASVTYDIVSLTDTKLVVKKEYGWGGWRFTFVAK